MPGGALSISESFKNKDSTNSLIIENSRFIACKGIFGGAIFIQDVGNLVIRGANTLFQDNQAKSGGAIAFLCQNYGMLKQLCSLTIADGVTFRGNRA